METLVLDDDLELAIARVGGAIENLSYHPMDGLGEPWGHIVFAFAELDALLPESLFAIGERGYSYETRPWPEASLESLEHFMRTAFACFRQARQSFNSYAAFTKNVERMQENVTRMSLLCPHHHGEIGWMFGES